jgi:glycolate oxidase iron-sulfur subunit
MQTRFTQEQLADSGVAHAEKILRKCVHCGFCNTTCPTYALLGDELDGPRGRIYLIKDMLENSRPATDEVVVHVDRCLSCLACMTTCPSGVNYMHLVDHARAHIEKTYKRSFEDRVLRWMLAWVLPRPWLFRASLWPARLLLPFAPVLRRLPGLDRFAGLVALAPRRSRPASGARAGTVHSGEGFRAGRVVIMQGCVQRVLRPEILESTINVLNRHGFEAVVARGEGCCGGLTHHLGREEEAKAAARRNIDSWMREAKRAGLEAIIVNASGCGVTVKDYAHMLRDDPVYAGKAERVAALAKDIHEFLAERGFGPVMRRPGLRVAYQAACSLQHGQRITRAPRKLLETAGFEVLDVAESHMCCGSAGTYNILQPEIAGALLARKVANLERTGADLVATGNIGCMTHIATGTGIPVVHTIELLDWATGGEMPAELRGRFELAEEDMADEEPAFAEAAQ